MSFILLTIMIILACKIVVKKNKGENIEKLILSLYGLTPVMLFIS